MVRLDAHHRGEHLLVDFLGGEKLPGRLAQGDLHIRIRLSPGQVLRRPLLRLGSGDGVAGDCGRIGLLRGQVLRQGQHSPERGQDQQGQSGQAAQGDQQRAPPVPAPGEI